MAKDVLTRGKYPLPLNRETVAEDWAARGYSCGLFTDPPGREWRDFVHATNELVTVLDGRLEMTVGGASCIAEPGDEVFIPAGARHSATSLHGSQAHRRAPRSRPSSSS